MADIFISYAREDAAQAAALADALSRLGWSVWRDDRIGVGQQFDAVIEQQLDLASCVIVLWSAASVSSAWVRAEASAADEQAKLLPVSLTPNLRMPIQFRQLNVVYLASMDLTAESWETRGLTAAIASLTGKPPLGHHVEAAEGVRGTRSSGLRLVRVGRWQLTARFFGVRATYDLTLRPNGSVSGRSKAGIFGSELSGRWAFDPAEQVLHLELSGGAEPGMHACDIHITDWEDDDTATCTFERRQARLRRLHASA